MQYVEETRWMPYSSQLIYEVLSDPQALAVVVGRIVDISIIEQNGNQGKLKVVLDLPLQKFVETEGEAHGTPFERMQFNTKDPFPIEFAWRFQPREQDGQAGTEVIGMLGFDFSVFGLPAVGMIVTGMIGGEIREDLERLEAELAKRSTL